MDHISKTGEITNKRLELMGRLAGTKWGKTQDALNITCNTYVKRIMKYGSEVIDTSNKANLQHLERAQNNALGLIFGSVKTTPVTAPAIHRKPANYSGNTKTSSSLLH